MCPQYIGHFSLLRGYYFLIKQVNIIASCPVKLLACAGQHDTTVRMDEAALSFSPHNLNDALCA